jgi:hypothetical protein
MRYLVTLFLLVMTFSAAHPQDTLPACPDAPPSRLGGIAYGRVTPGLPNNVRVAPDRTSEVVGQIPAGAVFALYGNADCDGDLLWHQVQYNRVIGWTAEGHGADYWTEPYDITVYRDDMLSFAYPTGYITNVSPYLSAAGTLGYSSQVFPNYLKLNLTTDPIPNTRPHASINVLPVHDITPENAAFAYTQIFRLSDLTIEEPDLSTVSVGVFDRDSAIPIDPFMGSTGRILVVQPHYMVMGEGTRAEGVAFVTAAAQDSIPVLNDNIFYNFIGFDRVYHHVVTVRFPIYTDALPTIGTFEEQYPTRDWRTNYDDYVNEVAATLNALEPDDWTPSLYVLDGMVQSIEVYGILGVTAYVDELKEAENE